MGRDRKSRSAWCYWEKFAPEAAGRILFNLRIVEYLLAEKQGRVFICKQKSSCRPNFGQHAFATVSATFCELSSFGPAEVGAVIVAPN